MVRFDPVALLESLGIPYTPERNNAYFRCPTCGDTDVDGNNFGIRLDGSSWGCWRSKTHGGPLAKVVRELTGWSDARVREYLEEEAPPPGSLDDLRTKLDAMLVEKSEDETLPTLTYPPEFRRILRHDARAATRYLRKRRGFDEPEVVAKYYDLRFATRGDQKGRVVLPIHDRDRLVGWAGRAIGDARMRYKAFPPGRGVKRLLFNERRLWKNKDRALVLVVVEGPMDALKLDWYGKAHVAVVALMGDAATPEQLGRLMRLARRFRAVRIVLDATAKAEALRLQAALPRAEVRSLPSGAKDPGELSPRAARNFAYSLSRDV